MPRVVIAFVVVTVILLTGFGAFQIAHDGNADAETKTNETFTNTTAGAVYSVNESSALNYSDTVTVRDENGTEMTAGTDYEWDEVDGNLTVKSGGALVNNSNGTVTYTYYTRSDAEVRQFQLWTSFAQWLPVLVLALGVLFLVGMIRAMT